MPSVTADKDPESAARQLCSPFAGVFVQVYNGAVESCAPRITWTRAKMLGNSELVFDWRRFAAGVHKPLKLLFTCITYASACCLGGSFRARSGACLSYLRAHAVSTNGEPNAELFVGVIHESFLEGNK